MAEFEGTSGNGNFQEALEAAVQNALKEIHNSDPMVSYVVKRISGECGGLAPLNTLTVVIETNEH